MEAQIFEILKSCLTIVAIVLSVWVIPTLKNMATAWLEKNTTEEQRKQAKLAISAAHALSQDDADKKAIVIDYLETLKEDKGWNISNEQLEILVEGLHQIFKEYDYAWPEEK